MRQAINKIFPIVTKEKLRSRSFIDFEPEARPGAARGESLINEATLTWTFAEIQQVLVPESPPFPSAKTPFPRTRKKLPEAQKISLHHHIWCDCGAVTLLMGCSRTVRITKVGSKLFPFVPVRRLSTANPSVPYFNPIESQIHD
jgi:hypothetical protein